MSRGLAAASGLLLLVPGCTRPRLEIRDGSGAPAVRLQIAVEDHSRALKHLRELGPGEPDTPEARRAALEAHRATFEAHLRTALAAHGFHLDPEAPAGALHLTLTSLGEVRTRYIVYGIASGVAWGVGTGLLVHDVRLAVGLGTYELVEESAFWIAGASLFGSFSAPVVLEAAFTPAGGAEPTWTETYYVLNGRKALQALAPAERRRRSRQVEASLDRMVDKVVQDFEGLVAPPIAASSQGHP